MFAPSPNILINPHFHRHINTAHPTDIRVNVFGTSGFDVTQINPTTVTFGGATPSFSFTRHINRDEWLDETFVFKGTDVHLPRGIIEATISGNLQDGRSFVSSSRVFNRDFSYYSPGQVERCSGAQAANPDMLATPIPVLEGRRGPVRREPRSSRTPRWRPRRSRLRQSRPPRSSRSCDASPSWPVDATDHGSRTRCKTA